MVVLKIRDQVREHCVKSRPKFKLMLPVLLVLASYPTSTFASGMQYESVQLLSETEAFPVAEARY